jgi:hypothetical protein
MWYCCESGQIQCATGSALNARTTTSIVGASSDAVAVLIIGFVMILSFFLGRYLAIKEILLDVRLAHGSSLKHA